MKYCEITIQSKQTIFIYFKMSFISCDGKAALLAVIHYSNLQCHIIYADLLLKNIL